MKLILFDTNVELCQEWLRCFEGKDHVEIIHDDLRTLTTYRRFDALVSPANSFGIMDGGIDKAIEARWPGVQERVQRMIDDKYAGYMPVGSCEGVLLPDRKIGPQQYLIVAPTMPWPMSVSYFTVYNVMRSILSAARRINDSDFVPEIDTLACSGIASLTGGVPAQEVAAGMQVAWTHHWRTPTAPRNWEQTTHIRSDIERALYGLTQ